MSYWWDNFAAFLLQACLKNIMNVVFLIMNLKSIASNRLPVTHMSMQILFLFFLNIVHFLLYHTNFNIVGSGID